MHESQKKPAKVCPNYRICLFGFRAFFCSLVRLITSSNHFSGFEALSNVVSPRFRRSVLLAGTVIALDEPGHRINVEFSVFCRSEPLRRPAINQGLIARFQGQMAKLMGHEEVCRAGCAIIHPSHTLRAVINNPRRQGDGDAAAGAAAIRNNRHVFKGIVRQPPVLRLHASGGQK